MHSNAVGADNNGNYYINIRHFSAVVAFDSETLEKKWTASSEIDSDFTFDKESSKFYN